MYLINNINYYWLLISGINWKEILSGKLKDEFVNKYIYVYYIRIFFKVENLKNIIMYKYKKF